MDLSFFSLQQAHYLYHATFSRRKCRARPYRKRHPQPSGTVGVTPRASLVEIGHARISGARGIAFDMVLYYTVGRNPRQ